MLEKLEKLGFFIPGRMAGFAVDIVVPAPYMDMDIFKVFEVREKPEVKVRTEVEEVKVVKGKFEGIKPAREVLESIVAEALSALGFNVQTNVRLPAKGGDIEVDVWGIKNIKGAQFRVYVSCKN